MATNPRLPDQPERRGPVLVEKPERPSSAFPGVVLAIITALLLLAAIMYFMPRAPKRGDDRSATAVPATQAQPGPQEIAISGLRMTAGPTGASLNLDGNVVNHGNEVINGMVAAVNFPLQNGQVAEVDAPVMVVDVNGKAKNTDKTTGDVKNPVQEPLKPGDQRLARITVDAVPQGWNHQMPTVQIKTTTGTTSR